MLISGFFVFFMQAGFAMLEAGIVQAKNATNILFKNMIDASLAAICFWLMGWGFAYGTDAGGFIGTDNFALTGTGWTFTNSLIGLISPHIPCSSGRVVLLSTG